MEKEKKEEEHCLGLGSYWYFDTLVVPTPAGFGSSLHGLLGKG